MTVYGQFAVAAVTKGPAIRGLKPDDYLRDSDTGLLATMFACRNNPLRFDRPGPQTGSFETNSALASLNISLNGTPVLLVCIPDFIDPQSDGDASTCVVAEREQQGPFRPWLGLAHPDSDFTVLQARPGTEPDDLEPLPSWLRQSSDSARSAVLGLFDLWAHAFLSGFYLGGIEWFCRHGTDLDVALRADWSALISALEDMAQRE